MKRRKDGLFFSNSWRKFATGSTSSTFHVYACMPCISRVSVRESFLTELAAVTTVNGVRDIYSEHLLSAPRLYVSKGHRVIVERAS